jgi:hypothetical protein
MNELLITILSISIVAYIAVVVMAARVSRRWGENYTTKKPKIKG